MEDTGKCVLLLWYSTEIKIKVSSNEFKSGWGYTIIVSSLKVTDETKMIKMCSNLGLHVNYEQGDLTFITHSYILTAW